ncbi:DEAD/DEAH box helicase [Nocardia sp. BMG51109]|uniref:DEAD/DEAH box helicase n=1 Tax=Nocardia sp. BMG51109 TaxID=1056816 RepID=UPI0004678CB2|nr:DEAD/DEAH box helicase [Nocardia sp. BMG51109]
MPPDLPGAPRFAELGLPVALVQALRRAGLETAFPIQAAVTPDILAGRDVLGRAATGSGKTLAFGLPLLVRVMRGAAAPRRPRALILSPTRELALQIERALDEPAVALGLRLGSAVGGVPIRRQAERLARGVDVLVATPGRLADLLARDAVTLDAVRVVAVDEADHMAGLGFLEQITDVLDRVPDDAQHLLFSATLDEAVDTLVRRYLRAPRTHSVAATDTAGRPEPGAAVANPAISHYLLAVRKADKYEVVTEIAARAGRTLLFVRTQYGADKLARRLRSAGVAAVDLHGGRSQHQRARALAAYSDGSAPVLVATDVAARGLHVDDISLVVQVDPPADPKDYLHRSGRTARAGAAGAVVTLVTEDDRAEFDRLLDELDATPTTVRVRPGTPELTAITGARPPSGRPLPDPAAPVEPPRPRDTPGNRGPRRPPRPRNPRRRNRSAH